MSSKYKLLRYIFRHFIIWTWALVFWNMMRFVGHEVVQDYAPYTAPVFIKLHLTLGVIAGVLFGSLDYLLKQHILKRMGFGRAVVIGTLGYLISIFLLVTAGMLVFLMIQNMKFTWQIYYSNVFTSELALLTFYCFQVAFLISFVQEVDKKFGPGNLWKMLRGQFYKPKEDDRIFMFLDLKSSTSIAEQLGHIQYSQLIQDCFKDLDVIKTYKAEIYQYVGDEVVLTWPKALGLNNLNCLLTFFAFREKINDKSAYYSNTYGLIPEFKAGLHVGKIVVAEVGEIKSEIAFHGDTINTAARIQGECNRLNSNILISGKLKKSLPVSSSIRYELRDHIQLRGKEKMTNVYAAHFLKQA